MPGYYGINCENNLCKNKCKNESHCVQETGECLCNEGWTGVNCEFPDPMVCGDTLWKINNSCHQTTWEGSTGGKDRLPGFNFNKSKCNNCLEGSERVQDALKEASPACKNYINNFYCNEGKCENKITGVTQAGSDLKTQDYCDNWCNVKDKWECGIRSIGDNDIYSCDCTGCNGC